MHSSVASRTVTVKYCVWDLNGNLVVEVDDLLDVILGWGPCDVDCCLPDFNCDDEIDVDDLVDLILHWGACPSDDRADRAGGPAPGHECAGRDAP